MRQLRARIPIPALAFSELLGSLCGTLHDSHNSSLARRIRGTAPRVETSFLVMLLPAQRINNPTEGWRSDRTTGTVRDHQWFWPFLALGRKKKRPHFWGHILKRG